MKLNTAFGVESCLKTVPTRSGQTLTAGVTEIPQDQNLLRQFTPDWRLTGLKCSKVNAFVTGIMLQFNNTANATITSGCFGSSCQSGYMVRANNMFFQYYSINGGSGTCFSGL